jgi:CheY-like chemotaxis protein
MTPANLPPDESGRIRTLHELHVIDTDEAQAVFDAIARMLHLQSGCPIALVCLADTDRIWLKGRFGTECFHVPREGSFFDHALQSRNLLEVPDCAADERFVESAWVTGEQHIRFYAGALITVRGHVLGSVCVADHEPRHLDPAGRQALTDMATIASAWLESRWQVQRMLPPETYPAPLPFTEAVVESPISTAAPATTDSAMGLMASESLRMLYVEDNRISAILFEEMLRTHNSGVTLRVAENGAEAIAMARNWQPDVLVLDAHLPDATGFDILIRLHALPGLSHVPAYMCSADAQPEDVQRAYEAGFIGYWTKPINISTVLMDISQWTHHTAHG